MSTCWCAVASSGVSAIAMTGESGSNGGSSTSVSCTVALVPFPAPVRWCGCLAGRYTAPENMPRSVRAPTKGSQ
ncbi:unnamed protein product [Mycena citricolor]|uniref:Uncharacterized protein n=1 Tax=Mycena citricolor TaxID=2018698 RepID=A0AAD2HYT9_9AGAR|nr:unnamed protein product [Mycena citricolor]